MNKNDIARNMYVSGTGREYIHRHYDENDNLHFCLIDTLADNKYFIDIDHCGEYGHSRTKLVLNVFKTKRAEVTIIKYCSCNDNLLREIIAGCLQEIDNH